ncbi:sodium-dependent transporter [Neisseria sp. N95_16]|uniref:Transporter n=1 Tax=Neisseria brasiliensis TaxID=2666100 RepID=A0A5Q3RVV2_9NEIS|nr:MULTISPECIES: sodium-dependent transporter [Neisseria]MRN37445.1 sodium-dependent transporter [Neisseria brasiliensis]PJO08910.1 sodium-dependent transporter [Neisseria sp. N95_16]PJO77240.1 sodium-dependent transporter [Neisseria sp. N177_16]QGL24442.1 sodium-dependent transporter [Neisseria brasiliensis]
MNASASWSSKLGFILSAAGSAIGLGAIWKFPYTAGTNGGAVFFLLFLLFTILVALPVQLAEFYIGRTSGKNAVDAFKTLAPGSQWPWVGRMGVAACFVLLSFYSVVGGWVLNYVVHAFTGQIHSEANFEALFGATIANPGSVLLYQGLFMLMTVWVVKGGISNGIEKANRYLMPALFVLFIVLAIRSMTLPNAMQGVSFLLKPDWSYFTPHTMLMALGQAFFALSIGVSTMITYASYLSKKQDLFRSGNSIMWMNLLVSLLAGLVIFPAVFAFGFEPSQGPGLIFIVLPAVFMKIPFGTILFAIFMLLVVFATLTSAFSMLETVIAATIRQDESKRKSRTWLIGAAIFIVGIPSALSFGVLGEFKIFGKTVFDLWDYMISAIIMPIGALSVAIFTGWVRNKQSVLANISEGSSVPKNVTQLWLNTLRFLAPIAILIVFINSLGWI